MRRIRWRVLALLFWLTLFFNIERLDLNLSQIDTINLPSSVYVIGALGALLALMPAFQRHPVGLLVGVIVVAHLGVLVMLSQPIIGEVDTYLTFTAILMLAVTVILAYNLGRSLSEFMAAVEQMTFPSKGGPLHAEHEIHESVRREMVSSRRNQRPLSMVLLETEAESLNMLMHRLIQDIQRLMMQRYLLSSVARVLSRYVRRTDLIIEGPEPGQLVLLAPETTTVEAAAFGERMAQVTRDRLGVDASFSVATFPEHALTYEELLNVAQRRMHEQQPTLSEPLNPEEQITRLAEQHAHDKV